MNVCINPSCSNVETFSDDVCPMCQGSFAIDTLDYIRGVSDLDSCVATIHRYELDRAEHTLFDATYRQSA